MGNEKRLEELYKLALEAKELWLALQIIQEIRRGKKENE
ncbi:hypothetical protein LCGC14_2201230 [marine sediment metagenome]|uniref:Uncharacterized protein n=1 Tax=marine sediment metagenome TaxID=412755 RepID=A0A0F9E3X8_9ZZZZ